MNKLIYSISVIFLILILAGCSENEKFKLQIEKTVNKDKTEITKQITDQDSIQEVQDIINKVKWSDKIVDMSRQPDIILRFKNSSEDTNEEKYLLWLNDKKIEMTKDSGIYGELSSKEMGSLKELIE